jgi:hypothetical protein
MVGRPRANAGSDAGASRVAEFVGMDAQLEARATTGLQNGDRLVR